MELETIKPIFDKYFVIVRLDIAERADKKHLENPGGEAVMEKYGGKGQGLPFTVILDAKGEILVDSKMLYPGEKEKSNMGYPGAPEEIANFIEMMKIGAPKMTAEEHEVLRAMLVEKAPKPPAPAAVPPAPPSTPPG